MMAIEHEPSNGQLPNFYSGIFLGRHPCSKPSNPHTFYYRIMKFASTSGIAYVSRFFFSSGMFTIILLLFVQVKASKIQTKEYCTSQQLILSCIRSESLLCLLLLCVDKPADVCSIESQEGQQLQETSYW